ncbi:MAG TPA: DUF4038 domain-containing protein [Bryobacteraceae bacterium]|nr:DUF4038 domain-containing protein [Bryobacteraceae bacterium]
MRAVKLPKALFILATLILPVVAADVPVAKWKRFEHAFQSSDSRGAAGLLVTFRSPLGIARSVEGFWDGGAVYRVRFSPDREGRWTFETASDDAAMNGRRGGFLCTAPRKGTRFAQHGPIRVSRDGRHLEHEDGTQFFWLADTAWNGPLFATPEDWSFYLNARARQGFTAVQWVATQWRGAPQGDASGTPAYTGPEKIHINPEFFQRLDRKHDAIVEAGLVSAPVMLWAISSRAGSEVNPGVSLPESEAIRLARYMRARWGADPVLWLINGDGDYRGPRAERWRNIGRGVFGDGPHAPVSLHPGGRMWVQDEFREEPWLDIAGYQSAHADSEGNSVWITTGPPAEEWKRTPVRPVISLEAPYEVPGNDAFVRRNHLWSLLNAPVAGVTYGAHAIWAWSDGVHPPAGHGNGVHPHWKEMLERPAAVQMGRLRAFFESIDWRGLRPSPELLAQQPGGGRFISAARSDADILIYTPGERRIALQPAALPPDFRAQWISAGALLRSPAQASREGTAAVFATPEVGDWLLLIQSERRRGNRAGRASVSSDSRQR